MITTSPAYYALLAFQAQLQKVILGTTAGVNPAMVVMGPVWAAAINTKAQATLNAFVTTSVGV